MNEVFEKAIRAVLSLHCKQGGQVGYIIGPYCAECTSLVDGGAEPYPCLTVKTVMDAMGAGE